MPLQIVNIYFAVAVRVLVEREYFSLKLGFLFVVLGIAHFEQARLRADTVGFAVFGVARADKFL